MSNEEKILAMLSEMKADISDLKDEQARMRADMGQMQADMGQMQTTLARVAVTQENIVLKGLDSLAEGQDLTHQRLKSLVGKDELTELREEVRLLRTVVAQHSRDIEALKAAQ